MPNSCAPCAAVVTVENGFGAACPAASVNRRIREDDSGN
jgi:NCAIR mutase (PurE)-related protein